MEKCHIRSFTDDLLKQIQAHNTSTLDIPVEERPNIQLFTLDVEALYPSIDLDMALESLAEALLQDAQIDENTKECIMVFSKMIFDNSYITFKGKCYGSKKGIATGGCVSRQEADILLHRLFKKLKPKIPLWAFISLWRRFIDDIFGIWSGTKDQFHNFVTELNSFAAPYGIKFGDHAIGPSVNFLDVTLSINETSKLIEYKLFVKPTDSRLYLRTESFHPPHVFSGVALSQMMRVINRNSTDKGKTHDLDQLEQDLEKSGHDRDQLHHSRLEAEKRIANRPFNTPSKTEDPPNLIVCAVDYFKEIQELQKVLKELEPDIKHLTGLSTSTMVAARKRASIGSSVVKNRQLGILAKDFKDTILCKGGKCMTCPNLIIDKDFNLTINHVKVNIIENINCKSSNVVYLAVCKLCHRAGLEDKAYVGQTTQPLHKRCNCHRSCFKEADNQRARSALALHSRKVHNDKCSMNDFMFMILSKTTPLNLDRKEQFFIERFRTNTVGMNRMMVVT